MFPTSDSVLNRIRWDDSIDIRRAIIGHIDRVKNIMIETPAEDWKTLTEGGDIPMHRIYYFKYNNEMLWDRENKIYNEHLLTQNMYPHHTIDCIRYENKKWIKADFLDTDIGSFKICSFNILFDKFNFNVNSFAKRIDIVVKRLEEIDADIICLQEILPDMKEKLLNYDYIKRFNITDNDLETNDLIILSKHAFLDVSSYRFSKKKHFLKASFNDFDVINVHLTSDHSGSEAKRLEQIKKLVEFTDKTKTTIVCGDFNSNAQKFTDMIEFIDCDYNGLPTFDPTNNRLARENSIRGVAKRLDRIFYLSPYERYAHQNFTIYNKKIDDKDVSDHFAISTDFVKPDKVDTDRNTKLCFIIDGDLKKDLNIREIKDSIVDITDSYLKSNSIDISDYLPIKIDLKMDTDKIRILSFTKLIEKLEEFGIECKKDILIKLKDKEINAIKRCTYLCRGLHIVKSGSIRYSTGYIGLDSEEDKVPDILDIVRSFGKTEFVGSYVYLNESDTDIDLVVSGEYDFETFCFNLTKELNRRFLIRRSKIISNKIDIIKLVSLNGKEIDVQYVNERTDDDSKIKHVLASIKEALFLKDQIDTEFKKECVVYTKKWAKAKNLYGQVFGYLPGISWTILALYVLKHNSIKSFADFINEFKSLDLDRTIGLTTTKHEIKTKNDKMLRVIRSIEPYGNTVRYLTKTTHDIIVKCIKEEFDNFNKRELRYSYAYSIAVYGCFGDRLEEIKSTISSVLYTFMIRLEEQNIYCCPNNEWHDETFSFTVNKRSDYINDMGDRINRFIQKDYPDVNIVLH